MMCRLALTIFLAFALVPATADAKPISREEYQRQAQVLEQLQKSVAAAESDADKFAIIAGVMTAERDVDLRRKVLDIAAGIPGAAQEAFFLSLLTTDEDAGIRSLAATTLGKTGSEKCLDSLAKAAASDRTTLMLIGDIGHLSSARRFATFALAELALRHPKLAQKAAAELRALPDKVDPQDNESLYDARLQALYQITRDDSLLKPFLDRMQSDDPNTRSNGVNAFQFLKLQVAPPEVVQALQDSDAGVSSHAALVLGRIGDPKSAAPLLAIAADPKRERLARVNAITALGQIRAPAAAELMEKLLDDPAVAPNAAIALYRITGKKVQQFPEGYDAD